MIIIAERINATRRPIREAILGRDEARLAGEIQAQDAAGAHYIDLNAGTGAGGTDRESEDLCWLVDLALAHTEKKLALDSADPAVLRRTAEHLAGRRPWLLNSVKGEATVLDLLLPLARDHQADVIGLAMDEAGIPKTAAERLVVCSRIADAAARADVDEGRLLFDPLVMPLSADVANGLLTLQTMRALKDRLGRARTVVGLSNVSHGLPGRGIINREYLVAALAHGLDAAICDPTRDDIRQAVLFGELIAGKDRYCRRYTRAARRGDL